MLAEGHISKKKFDLFSFKRFFKGLTIHTLIFQQQIDVLLQIQYDILEFKIPWEETCNYVRSK